MTLLKIIAPPCRVISAKTHHHAVDFNIFEGQVRSSSGPPPPCTQEVHGVADWVITGGLPALSFFALFETILPPTAHPRACGGGGWRGEGDQGGGKVTHHCPTCPPCPSSRFVPNPPFSPYVYDRVKEEEDKKVRVLASTTLLPGPPVGPGEEDCRGHVRGYGRRRTGQLHHQWQLILMHVFHKKKGI